MIYFVNRGFILEYAIADILQRYLDKLRLDTIYSNFHVSVTTEHPFAHLIYTEDAIKANDTFPCVVVSTQQDSCPPELDNLSDEVSMLKLDSDDWDSICATTRVKTRIVNGKEEIVTKNKEVVLETIPGYTFTVADSVKEEIANIIKTQGFILAIQHAVRKRDTLSLEIWSDNNQLKNELYEQLRLYLSTNLEVELRNSYKLFQPAMFPTSLTGERSNNFNFDFDTMLYGSHLTLNVDYTIAQIIIDTDAKSPSDFDWEVNNYVR